MSLNAHSVDLEEYFQVSNFAGIIDRDGWTDLPSRVGAATHRLLDTFDETASRATFFVLGWVAERHPGLVREIADRGHEIAWALDILVKDGFDDDSSISPIRHRRYGIPDFSRTLLRESHCPIGSRDRL